MRLFTYRIWVPVIVLAAIALVLSLSGKSLPEATAIAARPIAQPPTPAACAVCNLTQQNWNNASPPGCYGSTTFTVSDQVNGTCTNPPCLANSLCSWTIRIRMQAAPETVCNFEITDGPNSSLASATSAESLSFSEGPRSLTCGNGFS